MTEADERLNDLLDRWLASVDQHLRYSSLDDVSYWQTLPWPVHDRPTPWILKLAREKILELKAQFAVRQATGDGDFAASLELMGFLATLVGLQNIKRFIPLIEGTAAEETPSSIDVAATDTAAVHGAAPHPAGPAVSVPVASSGTAGGSGKAAASTVADDAGDIEITREMPQLKAGGAKASPGRTPKGAPAGSASKTSGRQVSDPAPGSASGTAAAAPAAPKAAAKTVPGSTTSERATAELQEKVIADAVRLLKWGRHWHELAESIERIADRPALMEIRRILRDRKAEIEKQAQTGRS